MKTRAITSKTSEKKEPVKCEKSVDGVFRVIDVDDKKPDLGSVKDKQ